MTPEGQTTPKRRRLALAVASVLVAGVGAAAVAAVVRARRPIVFQPSGQVPALAFSPDGETLAVATQEDNHRFAEHPDGIVELRSASTGQLGARLRIAGVGAPQRLAFSPDGGWLAASFDESGGVRVFSLPEGKVLLTLPGLTNESRAPRFAFARAEAFVSIEDGGTVTRSLPSGAIRHRSALLFEPDGIVFDARDESIALVENHGALAVVPFGDPPPTVRVSRNPQATAAAVAARPDGGFLLAETDVSGRLRLSTEPGDRVVTELASGFEPGFAMVISGPIAFSADGELIALAVAGFTVAPLSGTEPARSEVQVWQIATGERVFTFPLEPRGCALELAFSPTRDQLAVSWTEHNLVLVPFRR